MTLRSLYTKYVNEYDAYARAMGAHITAELYQDNFTVRVKKQGKVLPVIKVYAEHSDDKIKVVWTEGSSKTVKYLDRSL